VIKIGRTRIETELRGGGNLHHLREIGISDRHRQINAPGGIAAMRKLAAFPGAELNETGQQNGGFGPRGYRVREPGRTHRSHGKARAQRVDEGSEDDPYRKIPGSSQSNTGGARGAI
jgi:hypothetical protein